MEMLKLRMDCFICLLEVDQGEFLPFCPPSFPPLDEIFYFVIFHRKCIGARMGKLQVKLGIVLILSKFDLELHDKSMADKELEFDVKSGILNTRDELNFKVSAR